jgi:glycosyltransferase involved in cell wall biosynthesis
MPAAAEEASMHIGFFSFPRLVHGGGFERYLIELANELSARGHRALIVTGTPRQYDILQRALNVYYRNPLGHDNSRVTDAELRASLHGPALHEVPLRQMPPLLRRCHVVYAKNEVLDLAILKLLGIRRLPPIIAGVHTPMWYARAGSQTARLHNRLYLGRTYTRLLRDVRAVHVSNLHDKELFPRLHGWPRDRVFHVPYPYNARAGDGPSQAATDHLRIVFAGRLTEQKGVDILLEAVARINATEEGRGYAFTIAGSGEPSWEDPVRSAAERHANVEYLGHVPRERLLDLYRASDVAFVPSSWETFPYACLEPQSQGIPVVASDIPGCQDIVADGVTGFLFPVGDAAAAVSALRRVREMKFSAPAKLTQMGGSAIDAVRRYSDRDAVVAALERMFSDVAGHHPQRSTQEAESRRADFTSA